jgi:hypothetical protein
MIYFGTIIELFNNIQTTYHRGSRWAAGMIPCYIGIFDARLGTGYVRRTLHELVAKLRGVGRGNGGGRWGKTE